MSILDQNLDDVDVSAPVMAKGIWEFRLVDIVQQVSRQGKNMLVMRWALEEEVPPYGDHKASGLGFQLSSYLVLDSSDNYDPREGLKKLKLALTGKGTGPFGNPNDYIGLTAKLNIGVRSSEEYGTQNEIKGYVAKRE